MKRRQTAVRRRLEAEQLLAAIAELADDGFTSAGELHAKLPRVSRYAALSGEGWRQLRESHRA